MREIVETNEQLEAAVSDYEQMGYEPVGWDDADRSAGRTIMKRGYRGSAVWHVLFFVFAPFYGNFAYAAFRRFNRPEKVVIRIHDFDGGNHVESMDTDLDTPSADPDGDVGE